MKALPMTGKVIEPTLWMSRLLEGALAAGAVVLLVAEFARPAAGASANAEIHVRILPASGVGTLSKMQVRPPLTTGSMRNLGPSAPAVRQSSSSTGVLNLGSSVVSSPALVSITGRPHQTVAISFSGTTPIASAGTNLELSGLRHDGGITPIVDASGLGTFAITGEIAEADNLANFDVAAGAPSDEVIIVRPRMFDVLVSYN